MVVKKELNEKYPLPNEYVVTSLLTPYAVYTWVPGVILIKTRTIFATDVFSTAGAVGVVPVCILHLRSNTATKTREKDQTIVHAGRLLKER